MLTSDDYPETERNYTRGEDTFQLRLRQAREEAAASLGMLPGKQADASLKKALDHDLPGVRATALAMLAERGDKTVLDRVVAGLSENDYVLVQGVLDACRSLDDEKLIGAAGRPGP